MVVTTQIVDENGDVVNIDVTDEDIRAQVLATRELSKSINVLISKLGVNK